MTFCKRVQPDAVSFLAPIFSVLPNCRSLSRNPLANSNELIDDSRKMYLRIRETKKTQAKKYLDSDLGSGTQPDVPSPSVGTGGRCWPHRAARSGLIEPRSVGTAGEDTVPVPVGTVEVEGSETVLTPLEKLVLAWGARPGLGVDACGSLARAFEKLDINNDGHITMQEMKVVLCKNGLMGDDDAENFFKLYDENKDAKVTTQELGKLWINGRRSKSHQDDKLRLLQRL